jgi:hypothetical protein
MMKKITFLNPIDNKKTAFFFLLLFLANSAYYVYHAVFTPFVEQLINCRLIYLLLIAGFIFLSTIKTEGKKSEWRKILEILILILLPSAVLIVFGYFSFPEKIKNNPRFFANLIISISSFIFFLKIFRHRKTNVIFPEKIELNKSNKKINFLTVFFLSLIIIFYFIFGFYNLGKFAAVDEPLWTFERIPKFWNNVLDGEWQKTMISDKPGITVAILSGAGLNLVNPKEYELIKQEGEIRYSAKNIEKMNFSMRFPILIFNGLSLLVFYFLASKLFSRRSALFAVGFMGLSPLLLGISRIINPDSVFWTFSVLSLLGYFLFIKNNENKYLFFTAIFLGFSLLTKYVANFFFVFYFVMIFINYLLNRNDNENWPEYFKKSLFDFFIIVYISLLTFFIFLPAAWVNFGRIAEATIFSEAFLKFWKIFLIIILVFWGEIHLFKGKISAAILSYFSEKKDAVIKVIGILFLATIIFSTFNVLFEMKWINFEGILASPKSSVLASKDILGVFLANFYPMIFGIHPVIFLLFLTALAGLFFKKFREKNGAWIIYIMLFIFFYYLACFFNKIGATVRYQIIVYPLIFLIASLGTDILLSKFKKTAKFVFIGIVAVFLLKSLNDIKPFYFSYASEFLPNKYVLNLKDMGDGSYEASEYLNNLPDAKNLIIWTDKRGVCYFFKGGCMDTFEMNKGIRIDYFVVSASRQIRTARHIPYKGRHNDFEISVDKIYENDNYDFRLNIGGRPNNFIKIFSYEKLAEKNK